MRERNAGSSGIEGSVAASGSRTPVTVVGLGPMGSALARAFLEDGHPTTVWNRSANKADALVARGARRSDTVGEAVSASTLVVLCLSDYEAMHQVLDPLGHALSGKVLVNLGSGTPEEAREAAVWAEGRGADYLDGAIMVPPPAVGRPNAVFFYSGSEAVFEAHEPTLKTLGGDARYLGADPGLAVLYNTALLGMMWSTVNGFLHAVALVGTAKATASEFAPVAVDWFLPAVVSPIITAATRQLDEGEYPGDEGTVQMNLTAADHLLHTSRDQGIGVEVPAFLKRLLERAIAEGHGSESYMSLIEVLKRPMPRA